VSANIYATPIKPIEKLDIECWSPSNMMKTCEQVFGEFPVTLSVHDIPKLETLAAITGDGAGKGKPWADIIEKINKFGAIRVWAEH
jgi:hypothetical protein